MIKCHIIPLFALFSKSTFEYFTEHSRIFDLKSTHYNENNKKFPTRSFSLA